MTLTTRVVVAAPAGFATPLLAVLVTEAGLPGSLTRLDGQTNGAIGRLIAAGDFKGKRDETALLYPDGPASRVLLVGLGQPAAVDRNAVRRGVAVAVKRARQLGVTQGNYTEARSVLEESLALWQKLGYKGELGQAMSLVTLGMVARWGEKDIDNAETYFNQSLALFQKYEDEWGIAWNLFHLGITAGDRDQSESALAFLNQSLELYNKLGDPCGLARVSQFLGLHYLKHGEYQKAHLYFDQHLKNGENLHFMDGVSDALTNFGELYRFQGDYALAKKYYEKSLAISREHGMKPDIGANLYNLGLLALQQNDYPEALYYLNCVSVQHL